MQDSVGFLWIATMDGLNRYDGYEFRVFKHDEADSTSISENAVTALCQDARGNLWVGTWGGALNMFDYFTESFIRYPDYDIISGFPIKSIYMDKFGNLWVCSLGGGLTKVVFADDSGSPSFVHFEKDPSNPGSLGSNRVYSSLVDNSGALWVGTDEGLDVLQLGTKRFEHHRHDPKDHSSLSDNIVISIYEDISGLIWIGTGKGLDVFDRDRGIVSQYSSSDDSSSTGFAFVMSIYEQDSRFLWVGTQIGLNKLDRHTGKFTRYMHDPADPNSLPNNYITKVIEDKSGNIWLATDRGLSKLVKKTQEFAHYRHEPNRFASQAVTSILEDTKGRLWIGTEAGVKRFDHAMNKVVQYKFGSTPGNLRGAYVQAMFEDRKGNIWIGTLGGGLNRWIEEQERFDFWKWNKDPAGGDVMSICGDPGGDLWLGTRGEGLVRFEPEEERFERYVHEPGNPKSLSNNTVPVIIGGQTGVLWIGTEGGGLNRLAISSVPLFEQHKHNLTDLRTIADDMITALCEDDEGNLLIATGNGLDMYQRQQRQFEHLLKNDEDFAGLILGIVADDNGVLWFSTDQNGVYSFDRKSRALRHFDIDDGLQSNRFYFGVFKGRNGEILLGGENGFTMFHPDSITRNAHSPRIVLTGVRVFDKPFEPMVSTMPLKELHLRYDQNYFSFVFSALDYTTPSQNEYMYKLEGLNNNWIHSRASRLATYTNIDPGTYVFRVRGSNNDRIWNAEELAVKVIIDPPYWMTWWFRSLMVVTVIGILFLIHQYRLSKLLEIEKMRLRIAGDLHDDIGSSLGSIALTSDLIQANDGLRLVEKEQLAEISKAARRTAESLRDIVWVINPTSDKIGNLALKLKDEAASMLRGIDYSFEFAEKREDSSLDMEYRHNIMLVYKEILHNIVKHSAARSVRISIEANEDEFRMRVRDDGIGFDPSKTHNGNGLVNLKRRAQKMGGEIIISSECQKGTEITLNVKIP